MVRSHAAAVVVLFSSFLSACGADFTPYEKIDRFRVLAMAADPPWLTASSTTTIRALEVVPEGATVTRRWSWCPLSLGSMAGYQCALTREQLQAQIDRAAPGAFTVPSFELGTSSVAVFRYSLPPLFFKQACESLKAASSSISPSAMGLIDLPACDGKFPIAIHLEAEAGGEKIEAVKDIELIYGDGITPNMNPVMDAVTVTATGAAGGEQVLTEGSAISVKRGTDVTLRVSIRPDQAEPYTFTPIDGTPPSTKLETLAISWFIEAGKLHDARTGYIDGSTTLDDARKNIWTTPKVTQLSASTARVWMVLRDNRKGASWITRTVELR